MFNTAAVALLMPKQGAMLALEIVAVSGTSGLNSKVELYELAVPASYTQTVCVPGLRPLATLPVCTTGDHEYVNGPKPANAVTVAEPRLAQVIELLIADRQVVFIFTVCCTVSVPPPQL